MITRVVEFSYTSLAIALLATASTGIAAQDAPFRVELEQNGRIVPIEDHEARLRPEPFVILVHLPDERGVYLSASPDPAVYDVAQRGGPFGDIFNIYKVVGEDPQNANSARYPSPDGLFSYVPPTGWRLAEVPGMKYKAAMGPQRDGFASNINVVDMNLASLRTMLAGFEFVERREFVTDNGDRGIKMVGTFSYTGYRLHASWYFFDAGDKKLTATCTRLAGQSPDLDATLDQAMKSFRVEGR